MAEILDNEVITAEILNEISTDLGYSELKFTDNEKFGNDKLNLITGDLVGSGILSILNKCECTVSEEKIYVNTGVVVFADGAKKRITAVNELTILPGGKNYIFAKNDTSTGKIYLINSLTEPTGDYVLLAEYENGTLTDRRVIAKAKVQLPAEGNSFKMVVNVPEELESFEFSVPVAGASKLIFENQGDLNNSFNGDAFLEIFDIDTKLFFGFPAHNMDDRYITGGRDFFRLDGDSWYDTLTFVEILNDNAVFRVTPYPISTNGEKKKTNSHQFNIYIYGGIEK